MEATGMLLLRTETQWAYSSSHHFNRAASIKTADIQTVNREHPLFDSGNVFQNSKQQVPEPTNQMNLRLFMDKVSIPDGRTKRNHLHHGIVRFGNATF